MALSMNVRRSKSRVAVVAAFALAAGIAGRAVADPSASVQGPKDDASIARWVLAVDQTEEQTAAAVKPKLVSSAVWSLAERIAVSHAAADREFGDLAAGGPTAIDVPGDAGDLAKLSGDELDKAYVDREIQFHEKVLATLASDVIPSASSLALQDRLIAFRTELESELQHAREVQFAESFRKTAAEERAEISREISNDGP
jgi:putative membrane protein